jgi:hypothetical protein
MTILVFERWMVKPEKQEEHTQLIQIYRKFIKDNPEIWKNVRSIREYTQMFGGTSGMYIWLLEFDSLADYEKVESHMLTDEEGAKLHQEWYALIDPTTVSVEIWRALS